MLYRPVDYLVCFRGGGFRKIEIKKIPFPPPPEFKFLEPFISFFLCFPPPLTLNLKKKKSRKSTNKKILALDRSKLTTFADDKIYDNENF